LFIKSERNLKSADKNLTKTHKITNCRNSNNTYKNHWKDCKQMPLSGVECHKV